jgi:hypothetical protein
MRSRFPGESGTLSSGIAAPFSGRHHLCRGPQRSLPSWRVAGLDPHRALPGLKHSGPARRHSLRCWCFALIDWQASLPGRIESLPPDIRDVLEYQPLMHSNLPSCDRALRLDQAHQPPPIRACTLTGCPLRNGLAMRLLLESFLPGRHASCRHEAKTNS